MGVYYIHNKANEIVYIGKSNNIKKRVLSHLTGKQKKALSDSKRGDPGHVFPHWRRTGHPIERTKRNQNQCPCIQSRNEVSYFSNGMSELILQESYPKTHRGTNPKRPRLSQCLQK